ncbi:MAG: FGGY-family carbohydrate kinase, partial [Ruthenibacterium sp.]
EQQPECWRKAAAWLSPKDYLRFCLTGKAATEYTDAYNSLCIDRDTANWCDEILCATGLEKEKFPRVLRPFDKAGVVTHEAAQRFGLPEGTPVFAGGADMACGAVGMGLYSEGDSTLTLGTCATFLALVPGESAQCFGQVTYHLHASPGKLYALGSHINGGFAVNWLTRALSETGALDFSMMDALAAEAQGLPVGSNGVLTLPFLAGSGSPYFNARDRQTVLGCSAATTRAELFRSELEGITLNIKQTKEAFSTLVQGGLRRVLLGGGGSKISGWPQIVADVFGMQIELVSNADASAVGAAILGGFGA